MGWHPDDEDDIAPVPKVANKDVKQCKYCQRPITWKQISGRWVAYDVQQHDAVHKDFCHTGEHKFAVGDRIVCFWKSETIVYDVTMADVNSLRYAICQPKNSRKRYSDKTFPFKVIEKVGVKLDKVAAALYT